MDMLHQGTKLLVILFFSIIVVSCNRYVKYNAKEIQEIRTKYVEHALSIVGTEEYWEVYNQINDSIKNWRKYGLKHYSEDSTRIQYKVDSLLCFNLQGDKMRTVRMGKSVKKDDSVMDAVTDYYGVKIKGEWYFFGGSTMHIPREYYQKDIHTPLSFEKLKQIATSNIYRSYLKKNKKGEWEINERFFEWIIPQDGTKEIYGIKSDEEYVKFMIELNWSSDVNMTINKYKQRE
jgi:hypothetical protein